MRLRLFLLCLGLFISGSSVAQKNLQDYHYIQVPDQFEFLKGKDQYQVNSLVRFLFKKHGFIAYMGDELPIYLRKQPCKGLYADVQGKENFMYTRITVFIKDCYGNILFTSEEGKSKDKDYRKAYHGAVREAFISIEELNVKQMALPELTADATPDSLEDGEEEVEETVLQVVEPEEEIPMATDVGGGTVAVPTDGPPAGEEMEEIKQNALVYNDYELLLKDAVYVLTYKGDIIGKSYKTDEEGVFEIRTRQFNGTGYLEGDNFRIERNIEGMEETVTMLFTPKK